MPNIPKITFYKSREWRKTRARFIKTQTSKLCERCYAIGKYTIGNTVHHRRYLTQTDYVRLKENTDPTTPLGAKAFGYTNLELLCRPCHEKEHGRDGIALPEGFGFDSNGDIVKV